MATRTKSPQQRSRPTPPSSVSFPTELRGQVDRYARSRNLRFAEAVRVLVTERLRDVESDEQLRRARQWQLEQTIVEAEAIAAGDRSRVSWKEIEAIFGDARSRLAARRSAGR